MTGLENGWDTGINPKPSVSFECRNLLSARQNPEWVTFLLNQDRRKGFLLGPFDNPPFPITRISPLGLTFGKYSGKGRLIVDMSSPHGDANVCSINDLIDKDTYSVKYISFDDAIKIIQTMGPRTMLCCTEAQDAFHMLKILKDLWPYHCVKWQDKIYVYHRLVFGCRSSCAIYSKMSEAVAWIAVNCFDVEKIVYLLDDFMTFTKPGGDGELAMAKLVLVFNALGIPISKHKTVGPATRVVWLGLVIDTVLMRAELPTEKLERIRKFIRDMLSNTRVTKHELLKLLGHLHFATRVIKAGRPYVRYLIELSSSVTELFHTVKLNKDCIKDLRMWLDFLDNWNGVAIFQDSILTTSANLGMLYHSCIEMGFAGSYKQNWFKGRWPDIWRRDVGLKGANLLSFMEIFTIVACMALWGNEVVGKRILLMCKYPMTVENLSKGRSKSSVINILIRALTLNAAENSYSFIAELATSDIILQAQRMHTSVRTATPPIEIPQHVLDLIKPRICK